MNDSKNNCGKCGGQMEEGFIADRSYGTTTPSDWVEGEPVKSFWSGTKINDKTRYRVRSMRCSQCGFLESYATEDASDNSIGSLFS